jgi:hypothetical protein
MYLQQQGYESFLQQPQLPKTSEGSEDDRFCI